MSAAPPIPSTREFTLIGVAYALYVVGLFLIWPAIIGVVIAYVWQPKVEGTVLHSHARWLIRTFWWWTLLWALIIAVMLAIVLPHAVELGRLARTGDYLSFPWEMIATAVGGAIALGAVWVWMAIRLFRGTVRLADGRAIP